MRLLAWLCLVSPVEPPAALLELPRVYPALERLAHEEEVWCAHDGLDYVTAADGRCRTVVRKDRAVQIWRERRRELADAPHLCALCPFALDREVALAQLQFGRTFLRGVESRRHFYRVPAWRAELEEVRLVVCRRLALWDDMETAQNPLYPIVYRRKALERLRDRLGPFFAVGVMPPVVPAEFFTRIDP